MERTKEYPWGRCSACGYSGNSLVDDHPYSDHDYLCKSCLATFDKENPWIVEKKCKRSGDVFSTYRHSTKEKASKTLAALKSNPAASENGRYGFVMYHSDETVGQPF